MKRPNCNRILSFLLAFVMLCGSAPFPANSLGRGAQSAPITTPKPNQQIFDYTTLKITRDDRLVSQLSLQSYEKIDISADGLVKEATYQWQIQHPDNDAVWVNIYDCTAQTISVTAALVGNVLRSDGTAKLRCQAFVDNYVYQTEPVTVTLLSDAPAAAVLQSKQNLATAAAAREGAPADQEQEFVTVTVRYLRYDYVENAQNDMVLSDQGIETFTPYVATILNGNDLDTTVTFPSIVGYDSYILVGDKWEKATSLDINVSKVTKDIVYEVHYMPAQVKYTVHYLFQNVYDDNYVEDLDKKIVTTGETGNRPKDSYMNAVFDGFTAMYYQPEVIAADGSTVFEVYYERNYYLMDFDCDGGYGAAPMYVRYGTYISVPDPLYSGWSFLYWDMTGAWDDNNVSMNVKMQDGNLTDCEATDRDRIVFGDTKQDDLPITMPCFNTSFVALWDESDTNYTVSYWIKDPSGGTNHTFLGSKGFSTRTNESIAPRGDYFDFLECTEQEHLHSDDCYPCAALGHTHHLKHERGCYPVTWMGQVTNGGDLSVMAATNAGDEPQNGDIYFIYGSSDISGGSPYRYWPKMYLDGVYYTIRINNSDTIAPGNIHNYVTGEQIGATGSAGGLYAIRYRGRLSCGKDICVTDCGLIGHIHTDTCKAELGPYVVYDQAYTEDQNQDVVAVGDGSTILNEYYTYKTYMIRYVYARAVKSATGNDYFQYEVCTSTNVGTLEGSSWVVIGTTQDCLPKFTDPDGSTEVKYFDRGNYRYFYISVTASYGENIESYWPANNDVRVTYGNSIYTWGSWAAEVGTQYRADIGEHANVVGSYPTMSSEMITKNPEVLDEENHLYVAQNMISWWSGGDQISDHAYHNYFEVLSVDIPDGVTSTDPRNPDKIGDDYYIRATHDGTERVYILKNDYFVANHDGWTHVGPFEFIGFEWLDEGFDLSDSTDFHNGGNCHICGGQCQYCNVFFFVRKRHKLYFWNKTGYLSSGGGSDVAYGTSLHLHGAYFDPSIVVDHIPNWSPVDMTTQRYPNGLEPGAFYFEGWYPSKECVEGTKMDWEHLTMPDADFTVYANWVAVQHNVSFYFDYDQYQLNDFWEHVDKEGTPVNAPIQVTHGERMPTKNYVSPQREGYRFVGWFYLDETGKKRFAPETMNVKQELRLFAEWTHTEGHPTTYEIRYTLDINNTPEDPTDDIEIASPTIGYSGVGRTKTFMAKGGPELYEQYRDRYFPNVGSHSILMAEPLEDGTTPNTFTFRYVRDEQVYYKVRYLNVADNTPIAEDVVRLTTDAVVTEQFKPVAGYVPMPGYFYQTKALVSDGPDGTADNIREENVIIFYYMVDNQRGAFSVEYYVQDDAGTTQYGDKKYTLRTSYASTALLFPAPGVPNIIDSGADGEFSLLSFEGYSLYQATVTNFNDDGEDRQTITLNSPTYVEGTLDVNGLTIRLYYHKEQYAYTIQLLESGTNRLLGYGKLGIDVPVFANPNSEAPFGDEITYVAPESFMIGDIQYNFHLKPPECEHTEEGHDKQQCIEDAYEKLRTQSMTIRTPVEDDPNTENVNETFANELSFYYVQREVTVYYQVVSAVPGVVNAGSVSINSEIVHTAGALNGAKPTAGFGYRFAGWYQDAGCQTPVDPGWVDAEKKLKPKNLPKDADTVTYYAYFVPVLTSIRIQSAFADALDHGQDNFLVRIQGHGKTEYIDMIVSLNGADQVLLESVPVGYYTITLLTQWSWEYSCSGVRAENVYGENGPIQMESDGNTVTFITDDQEIGHNVIIFTIAPEDVDWLSGETSQEYSSNQ